VRFRAVALTSYLNLPLWPRPYGHEVTWPLARRRPFGGEPHLCAPIALMATVHEIAHVPPELIFPSCDGRVPPPHLDASANGEQSVRGGRPGLLLQLIRSDIPQRVCRLAVGEISPLGRTPSRVWP
jgi:hypothetical protein